MSPMSTWSPISPWPAARRAARAQAASPAAGNSGTVVRTGAQFQSAPGSPGGMSNLDRCNWCGSPRSVHGINWSCPSSSLMRGRHALAYVIGCGVAVLLGVGVLTATSQTATSLGTLGAAGVLAALTLLVCTAAAAGRRR
jgi:hypothetical protein